MRKHAPKKSIDFRLRGTLRIEALLALLFQLLLHNLTSLSEFTRLRHKSIALPGYQSQKGITFSKENSTHILNLQGNIFVTASSSHSTENTKQVMALACITAKPDEPFWELIAP